MVIFYQLVKFWLVATALVKLADDGTFSMTSDFVHQQKVIPYDVATQRRDLGDVGIFAVKGDMGIFEVKGCVGIFGGTRSDF